MGEGGEGKEIGSRGRKGGRMRRKEERGMKFRQCWGPILL